MCVDIQYRNNNNKAKTRKDRLTKLAKNVNCILYTWTRYVFDSL